MCEQRPIRRSMSKIKKYLKISSFRYLLKYANHFWGSIIFIVSASSIVSVISVGNAIITRELIDLAMGNDFSSSVFFLVLLGVRFMLRMGISAWISIVATRLNEKLNNRKQKELVQKLYES